MRVVAACVATIASYITSAMAADLKMPAPPQTVASGPWDVGVGSALMSDYNIRGITQSAHKPSIEAYVEPRYSVSANLQLYSGLSANSIDFPNNAAAQIIFYGGVRPTVGKLTVDLGAWYLYYPGGRTFDGLSGTASCTTFNAALCSTIKANLNFWEIYVKPTYAINDAWTVGGTVYYSPSSFNSGAWGTYASGTATFALPRPLLPAAIGASISAELGRYWFGTTDAFYGVPAFPSGINLPDYTTWNIGLSLTYRTFTLDLRYYDTDLSKANCNVQTDDHTATFGGAGAVTSINPKGLVSNWCGPAFIAKLSVDTALGGMR